MSLKTAEEKPTSPCQLCLLMPIDILLGSTGYHTDLARSYQLQLELLPHVPQRQLAQNKAVRVLSGLCFQHPWPECARWLKVTSPPAGSTEATEPSASSRVSGLFSIAYQAQPTSTFGAPAASGCGSRSGIRVLCRARELFRSDTFLLSGQILSFVISKY